MCSMLFGVIVTILIDDIITIIGTIITIIAMHEDGGGVFLLTARAAKPHPPSSSHASRLETLWG